MCETQPVPSADSEGWHGRSLARWGGAAADSGRLFVQTSFREKQIVIDVELPELPSEAAAVLSNRVLFEGREVLHLPDLPVAAG